MIAIVGAGPLWLPWWSVMCSKETKHAASGAAKSTNRGNHRGIAPTLLLPCGYSSAIIEKIMKYNPEIHHRRSIRLKGYDYSRAGAYFITICTKDRRCFFGEISNGEMLFNDAGRMIWSVWNDMPLHYSGVEIDEFVVMPNHFHGIVVLVGAGPRACPGGRLCDPRKSTTGQPQGVVPALSLPDVAHRFKTMTTKCYTDGVKQSGWMPYPGKLWQRNYWDHIIRNESTLDRLRGYIRYNPAQWESDQLYNGGHLVA